MGAQANPTTQAGGGEYFPHKRPGTCATTGSRDTRAICFHELSQGVYDAKANAIANGVYPCGETTPNALRYFTAMYGFTPRHGDRSVWSASSEKLCPIEYAHVQHLHCNVHTCTSRFATTFSGSSGTPVGPSLLDLASAVVVAPRTI